MIGDIPTHYIKHFKVIACAVTSSFLALSCTKLLILALLGSLAASKSTLSIPVAYEVGLHGLHFSWLKLFYLIDNQILNLNLSSNSGFTCKPTQDYPKKNLRRPNQF